MTFMMKLVKPIQRTSIMKNFPLHNIVQLLFGNPENANYQVEPKLSSKKNEFWTGGVWHCLYDWGQETNPGICMFFKSNIRRCRILSCDCVQVKGFCKLYRRQTPSRNYSISRCSKVSLEEAFSQSTLVLVVRWNRYSGSSSTYWYQLD